MSIQKISFGNYQGEEISLYRLTNGSGMVLSVMNYGATITSLKLPTHEDIVCGFDNFEGYFSEEYKANSPYFGAAIGRYCATIAPAKFGDYELSKNAGENNLHGGVVGFDKRVWSVKELSDNSITFTLTSEDGDQGFPGEVVAEYTITLDDENALTFHYQALSSKSTPLSMTNHNYYNLSGFAENVENHAVTIDSIQTFAMDAKGSYNSNCKAVEGTPTDLREERRIGDLHEELGAGMEHFYLFEGGVTEQKRKVAEVSYPSKGRKVEIFTTEGGMLFYTAKYTSDALERESGEKFGKYRAFCCETHRVPNGPNVEGAPNIFTEAGERFSSETTFKFTI